MLLPRYIVSSKLDFVIRVKPHLTGDVIEAVDRSNTKNGPISNSGDENDFLEVLHNKYSVNIHALCSIS